MVRDGYITDGEDMLHDVERAQLLSEGKLTDVKRASIQNMLDLFGADSIDLIVRTLNVRREAVEDVIEKGV